MGITKASTKHLEELAFLQKKYMQYHKKIDDYFAFKKNISELWKKYMEQSLQNKNHVTFIANVDNKIVGYIHAKITQKPSIYKIDRIGVIGDAFVLPEFRKQGIFTKLTETVFNWMRERKIKYVEHPVAEKNKLGREVWKKRAFEEYMIFMKRKL